MFQKKTPYEREWEDLQKKESKFLKSREEKQDSLLNKKLEEKIPEKLQSTLDAAFEKAFGLIFDKGTAVIEKTYKKDELEKEYKINAYTDELRKSKKTLHTFSKKAAGRGRVNLLLSGVSGVGMGVLGIGIPDIPVFTGMLLKSVYEIALSYGYEYESEKERAYILLLIQGAVSYGEQVKAIDEKINDYIDHGRFSGVYDKNEQIKATAASLSKELLYMKFLQGIPVVGAVGGLYDAVYMKRITQYANLKYRRRFLLERKIYYR